MKLIIPEERVSILTGKRKMIIAKFYPPPNQDVRELISQHIKWSTDKNNIVDIISSKSLNEQSAVYISAKNPGSVKITAEIKNLPSITGGVPTSDSISVTVKPTFPQKILIDAGHYADGNTFDHIYNGEEFTYKEGRQMWKLQEFLVQELKNIGFIKTERLRENNESITTWKEPGHENESWEFWMGRENRIRGEKAGDYDLFIQLHSNAPKDWITLDEDNFSLVIRPAHGLHQTGDFADNLEAVIKNTMELQGDKAITIDENEYAVLRAARDSGCPRYFLAENGFHTNVNSARWLDSDENLKELAKAYAEVIKNYFESTS